jgi:hypothetical protein
MRLVLPICLLLAACGTTRKISNVEIRELASGSEPITVSELRARAMQLEKLPRGCPAGTEVFSRLVSDRLQFPPCPKPLTENFPAALRYLKMEERSTLEEAIESQCRSIGKTQFGESLESLFQNFDSTGPLGRRAQITQTLQSTEGELKVLAGLKKGLEELVYENLPLDRWAEANGDFVVPERELAGLERMIRSGCRLSDEQLEHSYQMTRAMEELLRVLKDGEIRDRLERFLGGVYRVIDERIQEFFYPDE